MDAPNAEKSRDHGILLYLGQILLKYHHVFPGLRTFVGFYEDLQSLRTCYMQLIVSLRPPAKYYQGEIAYMWLSLLAKGVLGLLVLSNVLVLGSFTDIYA